jgi:hypothetical protein
VPICYCLIPEPSTGRVLLVRTPEGWTLPVVEHRDDWFAHEACVVARDLGRRLGIHLTALREMHQAGVRLCELENHDDDWRLPGAAQWVNERQSRGLRLVPPGQRVLLRTWFQQELRRRPPVTRAPWERRGWYAEALAWIREQLAGLRLKPAGPVEQFKTAWACSCILRVPTTTGDLYFKAVYARPPREAAVVAELARRWPRHVPRLRAVDHERGWMIADDFGPGRLGPLALERWENALRLFGRLQRGCSNNLQVWSDMGCPDRRPEMLVRSMAEVLDDPILEQADPHDRLSTRERKQLLARRACLRRECLELADSGIPVSIMQQDFRDGNIAVHNRTYLFYDWSDTVLSHPFFSACRFLEYVPGTPDRTNHRARLSTRIRHERLRDAYLDSWTACGSRERLRKVFQTAQSLNPLYQAVRWHQELPWCEPGSPWWRDMISSVTCELKRLSARFDR